ncbi:hypothetical protein [Kineobactrum salinum]|uniref:Uncharacterized protein n=1 Tax=Kineobactrum salinum TaxID=2708301 RepID=A0A6C0UB28_9GAMM|nr:hypothetical protein [Kineobactrum salinum]QIB67164.1 hypothetical protein G3T16_18910 [Kineobactrum salinum]
MTRAVDRTIRLERPELIKGAEEESAAATDTAAATAAATAATKAAEKTVSQRKANAAAAAAQPTRAGGKPNAQEDAGTLKLDTLTEEEFDALPESTLAKLRGDDLL